MNNFYTYVYLDPRKPGNFDCEEFHFDFEPFYVGKGKGVQWLLHLRVDKNKTYRSYKLNKIRKIQSLGLQPKIIKYKENLTEQEAFDLEKKLIKAIGRLDLVQGPLTNLTGGGEGSSGLIHSEESRQKRVEKMTGRTKENNLGVAKQAEKLRGRTKETHFGVAKQAEKLRGRTKETDLGRARVSEKLTGRTKETDPSVARQAEKIRGRTKENNLGKARAAEKMKVIMKGRTKENNLGVARAAETKRGRTKENHSGVSSQAEKMRGRTKENHAGVARGAEKMKGRTPWNKGLKKRFSMS